MASSAADDHIGVLNGLVAQRSYFENAWRQVRSVAAPDASDFRRGQFGAIGHNSNDTQRPGAAEASKTIYDSTAVWCVDRLSSGIEALVIPQSDYWHGYDTLDYDFREPSEMSKLFLERLRNLTFKMRYDADSGWIHASQTAIRRMVAFGNAFVMVEDGIAGKSVFLYRYMPLAECYAAENHYGQIDTFYRCYSLTARQAYEKFGNALSQSIIAAANNPKEAHRSFTFLQCIHPRQDFGLYGAGGIADAKFASTHIEFAERRVVGESGYYEFPVVDFRWLPEAGNVYGEGPIMKCLADIQSLNAMAKNELIAGQQAINPPLLMANAGVMNRPRSQPGAINMGGLNMQGQEMVKPMFSGQRLDFATTVLEAKRNQVKESLYINLFALLVQNPQMSATEAMIRANEKGELLGPAGAGLQTSLSRMNARELGIMKRRGTFNRGSAFEPPREIAEREIGTQFTSTLDRLRRGREVEGTLQVLNTIAPLAQIDPSVTDNIDADAMTRGLAERLGMPVSFVRKSDEVKSIREAKQQQQALAANAAIAKDFAAASKSGVEAMAQGQQAGVF